MAGSGVAGIRLMLRSSYDVAGGGACFRLMSRAEVSMTCMAALWRAFLARPQRGSRTEGVGDRRVAGVQAQSPSKRCFYSH